MGVRRLETQPVERLGQESEHLVVGGFGTIDLGIAAIDLRGQQDGAAAGDLDVDVLLGDDAHAILDHIEASGAKPIIPQRTCMPRTRAFDAAVYKLRNRIERTIGWLKQLRRIATRYDRLPANYLASLYLASLRFWC